MPYHVRKIPTVKVGTPKCSTTPKSAIVSIKTKAIPPAIAGLATGNATFQNNFFSEAPKTLAASLKTTDC